MEWLSAIISIISGVAVCIPLVIKLYKTVTLMIKNKNWNLLIQGIMKYMMEAQTMFSSGRERKEYIMNDIIYKVAVEVNYDLTEEDVKKIDTMIDSLCDMAHVVGVPSDKKTKK